MEVPTLFITAFMVGFSGALVPGPLLTITIDRSLKYGAKSGPLVILGHAILEFTIIAAIVLGLGSVLRQQVVTRSIGIVGGLVLVWMGYNMVKDWKQSKLDLEEEAAAAADRNFLTGSAGSVLGGVIGSVSNPYWFLWWATIGAAFITQSLELGMIGLAVFFVGHILSDFVWYSAVSFTVAAGRKFINNGVYQWILMICGLFLIFLAAYFIWSGVTGNISV